MQVASPRDRLLAGLVDGAVAILGIAAVVGLGIGLALAYSRVRSNADAEALDEDQNEEEAVPASDSPAADHGPSEWSDALQPRQRGFEQSRSLRAAIAGAAVGLGVAGRNWRGPGFRIVGLRRVDARTGGPVSVRSGLIGVLFTQARSGVTKPLLRAGSDRERHRIDQLAPKLREIERLHAADRQAHQRAVRELYETNDVSVLAGCMWPLARLIALQLVQGVAIRDRRTIYDRVTGTIVVIDR